MGGKISSLNEFAVKLNTAGKGFVTELEKAIALSTAKVHSDALKKFGEYQPEVGPFQAWAVLAPATLREKFKAGAEQDDPLIGHYAGNHKNKVYNTPLRNSLLMQVQGLTGIVGTDDPLAKYHEFGTYRIPARPFLRPSLYQNREWIKAACADAIARALRTY